MSYMLPLARLLPPLVLAVLALTGRAEVVRVGGTGSSDPLIETLAQAYRGAHPEDQIHISRPPLGSSGALRALAAGKLDIAVGGREPKPEEQAQVGRSAEWVRTPLVMATRDGQRPGGFTTDDLVKVHAGSLVQWSDGAPIRLVLRSASESDTLLLRGLSPAMDAAMAEALARKGMAVAENDLDTLGMLEKTRGSLGPVTLGLLRLRNSRLRVLPLDGVAPTVANLAAGRYRLGKSIHLAVGRQPSAATQRFLGFLRSGKAREILKGNDFLPLF